jgi:hypothetical protein
VAANNFSDKIIGKNTRKFVTLSPKYLVFAFFKTNHPTFGNFQRIKIFSQCHVRRFPPLMAASNFSEQIVGKNIHKFVTVSPR